MKATLAALALFAATQAAAEERMTLMLDWFVNPDHGPMIVAEMMRQRPVSRSGFAGGSSF